MFEQILEGEIIESRPVVRKPSRTELKALIVANMIKSMAIFVRGGFNPSLAVVTSEQALEIPWEEMPVFFGDSEGGGVLASAKNMIEIENIEEVSIVGVPCLCGR